MEPFLARTRRTVSLVVVAAVVAFALASCGKTSSPPPAQTGAGSLAALSANATSGAASSSAKFRVATGKNVSATGGHSIARVTYAPNVKMIGDSEMRASLAGIASDGHRFVFKNAGAAIRNLQAGDILMVKGEMAAKVLGAVSQGEYTLVVVAEPSLGDLLQQGDISIDAPVRFHGPASSSRLERAPLSLWNAIEPPLLAQGGREAFQEELKKQKEEGEAANNPAAQAKLLLTSGWKVVTYSIAAENAEAAFHVVLAKQLSGFVGMIAMKGTVGNLDFTTKLSLDRATNGQAGAMASEIYSGLKNSTGAMQFDWEIGKSTPGVWAEEDRVKLPIGITVPLAEVLDGLPVSLDISTALLIHPGLTGGNEYSRGGFSVGWSGGGGFQARRGGAVTGDNSISTTFGITADGNISPVAANNMVVSYCARFELRVDVFGPFAESVGDFGGAIDTIASQMESLLPKSVLEAADQSPLSRVTASSILQSNADVYAQFIATEGVVHAPNVTSVPCSKQEIKFSVQGGAAAQLFGLTPDAKIETDLFSKTYTQWNPPTAFCKGV
jgi:hypothetical protein